MAKESGLGMALTVDDAAGIPQTISNDFVSVNWATPRGVQDVTGIDKSAMERLLLLADFSITINGVLNPATDRAHDVFKTVPSTSVARTTTLTLSGQTLANEVLFTDYAFTRPQSGEATFSVPGVLSDGVVPVWT